VAEEMTDKQFYGMARGRSVTELTFTGGDKDRPRAIAIVWRPEKPWIVAVYGPFKNKTTARRWGQAEYPRRHVVVGLHTPPDAGQERA
jgi:hypothetical protein